MPLCDAFSILAVALIGGNASGSGFWQWQPTDDDEWMEEGWIIGADCSKLQPFFKCSLTQGNAAVSFAYTFFWPMRPGDEDWGEEGWEEGWEDEWEEEEEWDNGDNGWQEKQTTLSRHV